MFDKKLFWCLQPEEEVAQWKQAKVKSGGISHKPTVNEIPD